MKDKALPKILIADDHTLFREGIKRIIAEYNLGEIVAEVASMKECVAFFDEGIDVNVLILDCDLPETNGFDLLLYMRSHGIRIRTLLISDTVNEAYLMKAQEAKTKGFICKNANVHEFVDAVRAVTTNKDYMQVELIPALNAALINTDTDSYRVKELSKRELEVLKHLSFGSMNKDIASIMNISERTVKNHISSIFKKIQVSDRTQAAIFAIRNDIVKIQ